jgi:calcineurin-like phosphoesterase family protein
MNNWNSCIREEDEIYIVGDLVFKGNGLEVNALMKRLNGKKYLIKGNHDTFIEDEAFDENNFTWIKDYYVLNYRKLKIILFHYPLFEWEDYFSDGIHLYGHVHNCGNNIEEQKRFKILGKRAINVGVDVNNFYPISIEKIMKMADGNHL